MFKLLIATHNPGKLKEISQYLRQFLPDLQILSLRDLKIKDEPEETGKTFLQNAKLKAHFYARLSKHPVLADDGGLKIDALNGEPGIHSSRWLGKKVSDQRLITYCLERMKRIPKADRTAQFKTCVYFYNPKDNKSQYETGVVEGIISEKPTVTIQHGYPYRSIFFIPKLNKMYVDLTRPEHDKINHRKQALKKMAQKLKSWYN